MTGSAAPIYRKEFADLRYDGSAEAYLNDNAYKADNALNNTPSNISQSQNSGARRSLLGSPMKMADLTREEMKAEIAASEARGETKIARMEGKLDLVLSKLDHTGEYFVQVRADIADSRRAGIANAWVIFGALVVVIGILVTVAPIIFDMGFKWRETITKEVQDRIPQNTPPKSK